MTWQDHCTEAGQRMIAALGHGHTAAWSEQGTFLLCDTHCQGPQDFVITPLVHLRIIQMMLASLSCAGPFGG
jgi:hypothetical protein